MEVGKDYVDLDLRKLRLSKKQSQSIPSIAVIGIDMFEQPKRGQLENKAFKTRTPRFRRIEDADGPRDHAEILAVLPD